MRGRWLAALAVVLVALVAGAAFYALRVEPTKIEITHQGLDGSVRRPLRIAQVSDVHAHGFGARERNLVLLVQRENPDVIVLTGDTVDGDSIEPARDLLLNLSAPLGVWIVRGGSERWTIREDQRASYTTLGAHFLENSGALARDDLWIAGLDDPSHGSPDVGKALAGAPPDAFKLALLHAPDHFNQIAGRVELALAGATLGGQVVLPGIGPLFLPPGGKLYVAGWFTRNSSQLYVSRGLGTPGLGLRLGASPELAIIDVRPR